MKKFLGGLLVFVLAFSHTWGAIYYDPETNTYYTDDEQVATEENSDAQHDDATGQDDQQSSSDHQEDGIEQTQQTTTTGSTIYGGTLGELHTTLRAHTEEVKDSLDIKYDDLRGLGGGAVSGSERLDVLKCLELVDKDLDLAQEMGTVHKQLRNKVGVVAADLHSEISALEVKVDEDLLDPLVESLEKQTLRNKVNSFLTEYTDVVETFYTLFEDRVLSVDSLIEEASDENQKLLEDYDERVALYKQLNESYDEFISKSSFAGVLAGPNIQQLYNLRDKLSVYYRSLLNQARLEEVVAYVPKFVTERQAVERAYEEVNDEFSTKFSTYADELLKALYPVDELLVLHKNVLALRAAYAGSDGQLDCQAFAYNPTIDKSAPQLMISMDEILDNLNTYVAQVTTEEGELPKDINALKDGLQSGLATKTKELIADIVTEQKRQLQQDFADQGLTMMAVPVLGLVDKEEKIVRAFLQAKFIESFEQGEMDTFQSRLGQVDEKIDTALSAGAQGITKQRLEMIKKVMHELLL